MGQDHHNAPPRGDRIDEIEDRLADVEKTIVAVCGRNGTNGKLSVLSKTVDQILSRAWWILTVLVGCAGGAATKLVFLGAAAGEMQAQIAAQKESIALIQAELVVLRSALHVPAPVTPGKDQP